MGTQVLKELAQLRQCHAARGAAASVDREDEQLRAVPAHAHRSAGVDTSCQVALHRRHLAVGQDPVAPCDRGVDLGGGTDLHVHLVAHLELRERERAGLATQQHLAAVGDLRIASLVDEPGCLDDLAVDDGHARDVLGERVRSAHRPIERVVTPGRGVDADRVLREPRVVEAAQVMLLPVRDEGAGGGEHLHGGLLARDREAGHRCLRSYAQLAAGH